jgi:hypothetical protein
VMLVCGTLVPSLLDRSVRTVISRRVGNTHPMVTLVGVLVGIRLVGAVGVLIGPTLVQCSLPLFISTSASTGCRGRVRTSSERYITERKLKSRCPNSHRDDLPRIDIAGSTLGKARPIQASGDSQREQEDRQ